jgi:lysophospholipase L1-like esterase
MRTLLISLCLFSMGVLAAEPERISGLSTTTPVTQDRDHAIYDWQERHAEVLARNQEFKPEVVIFGDSIIHYWGGEPKAPKASRLSGVPWLTYRDFDRAFRGPDGVPDAKLFSDGVHLNADGYEILGAKIPEQVLALLN